MELKDASNRLRTIAASVSPGLPIAMDTLKNAAFELSDFPVEDHKLLLGIQRMQVAGAFSMKDSTRSLGVDLNKRPTVDKIDKLPSMPEVSPKSPVDPKSFFKRPGE